MLRFFANHNTNPRCRKCHSNDGSFLMTRDILLQDMIEYCKMCTRVYKMTGCTQSPLPQRTRLYAVNGYILDSFLSLTSTNNAQYHLQPTMAAYMTPIPYQLFYTLYMTALGDPSLRLDGVGRTKWKSGPLPMDPVTLGALHDAIHAPEDIFPITINVGYVSKRNHFSDETFPGLHPNPLHLPAQSPEQLTIPTVQFESPDMTREQMDADFTKRFETSNTIIRMIPIPIPISGIPETHPWG